MIKIRSRNSTLQKKILISNTVFVAILCLIFFVSFVYYYTKVSHEKLENNYRTVVETQVDMFEQIVDMGKNISYSVRFTPEIIETFRNLDDGNYENHFIQKPVLSSQLYDYTLFYLNQQDFISRICFYNQYGDFTYVGSSIDMGNTPDYISKNRLQEIDRVLEAEKIVYQLHDQDELSSNKKNSGYISIIQKIVDYNLFENKSYGFVEIQISYDLIYEQMEKVSNDEYWEISLNEDNVLVFGEHQGEPIYEEKNILIADKFLASVSLFDKSNNLWLYVTIIISGLITVLIMIIVYCLQGRIVKRITEPLVELCQNIQITEIESFEQMNQVEFDEVSQLKDSFAMMLQKLQKAVDDLVVEQTSKMDAQILALQAQINPHFIHNTLALNNSLIEEGRLNQAMRVSSHLSDMIRYSADFSQQMVKIEEELSHIRDYLELLKIKYEEDFSYKIENRCQDTAFQVPKFILQPLVENSIVHSLKESDFPWKIHIICEEKNNKWNILVEDGGIKISPEKAAEIKQTYLEISDMDMEELLSMIKIGGFSLMNILIRMHFLYKGDMEFNMFGNDLGGTTVMIGGPMYD